MAVNVRRRTTMRSKISAITLSSLVWGALAVGAAKADNPPPAPVAGRIPLGVTVSETQLIATGWRVSKFLHVDVRNDKGEKIGRVDDILVSNDATLTTAIIDVGGFLGMGAYKVAIPVKQFRITDQANKVVLPGATKD